MSFGSRGKVTRRRSPSSSPQKETEDEDKELLTWDEKNPIKLQGIIALGSCVVVIALLLISSPHTYAAKSVRYTGSMLVESALSAGLVKEHKEKAEKKLGVDFGRILTTKSEEATSAMKSVAAACMRKKYKSFLMPSAALHRVYGQATDYLICAMKTKRSRFCSPNERQRLAEQLIQYAERRQNVLAYERAYDEFMEKAEQSRTAQHIESEYKAHNESLNKRKVAPVLRSRLAPTVDPRIIEQIKHLVQVGYLSSSDFGYMGFYLPEDYADVLTESRLQRSCI